jgi:hypothetical protein
MHVRPAPGFTIRDPDLKDHLPQEGRDVPDSPYWHRRLRDGDVVSGAVKTAAKHKSTDRSAQE